MLDTKLFSQNMDKLVEAYPNNKWIIPVYSNEEGSYGDTWLSVATALSEVTTRDKILLVVIECAITTKEELDLINDEIKKLNLPFIHIRAGKTIAEMLTRLDFIDYGTLTTIEVNDSIIDNLTYNVKRAYLDAIAESLDATVIDYI